MTFDPRIHHRRSIRLPGYDYTQPGAYFVTLVVWQRECLLGEVVEGEVRLSPYGQVVWRLWQALPSHAPHLHLGAFVIMPDHIHGILWIMERTGESGGEEEGEEVGKGEAFANRQMLRPNEGSPQPGSPRRANASPRPRPIGTQPGSLGAAMQSLKSVSTRQINQLRRTPGAPVWQRNYYERIVRDQAALERITAYILHNPRRWQEDQLR
jgi:REP element-mobilizing transposase RayT